MPITTVDLEPHIRGNNISYPIEFKKNNLPVDYTGWKLIFSMKYHPLQRDEEAVLRKEINITGTSATLNIEPGDTGSLPTQNFYYDLQLVSPAADEVQTVMTGRWQLLASVTHNVELP
nr:hypothetical protein [Endozoicomonas sp.]